MGKLNIKSKELSKIGYINDQARSVALNVINRFYKFSTKEEVLNLLCEIKETPESFIHHELLAPIARTLYQVKDEQQFEVYGLREIPNPFNVYGNKFIEPAAKKQMELAMRLPVSVGGALMPDAHVGYGLPVGGVLATENAIIPYAVGVDIGCRMTLSIFDIPEKYLTVNSFQLKNALKNFTHFGMEGGLEFEQEHEVLDRSEFSKTDLLRKLHGKAVRQLGTSGGGNHFVEFGIAELTSEDIPGIQPGKYLALLSHSGSRGLGAAIAKHYCNVAMDVCKLPREAQHLAWLDMKSEAGQEYWMSMNLAGEYAKACHDRIHINLAKAIGERPVAKIENHHNFAWEEIHEGRKVIVHRKGATPADENELGIIPGSMIHAGYIVKGKGNKDSFHSASHGAGRRFSRGKAKESFTMSWMKKLLSASGVTLIGGTTEESPAAYKNIEEIISAQTSLVDVVGKFQPKIVRMSNHD